MTMTTGEFDFEGIFRVSNEGPEEDLDFPYVTYILWIIFIIVMPILLTNMLVSKIQSSFMLTLSFYPGYLDVPK